MLSYRLIVCVVVTVLFVGCNRHDIQPTPDTSLAVGGSSAMGNGDSTRVGASPGGGPGRGQEGAADTAGTPTTGSTTTAPNTIGADSSPLSDAQVAAVTEAANDGEVAQGKVAQGKAHSARVKAFAAKMIAHHSQAKTKQGKLGITPAESPLANKLRADGEATLASLNSATAGPDFDQTYIKSQIDGHQKVLDAINDRLLPAVKDEKLTAYVKEIKPTVEAHLKEAREIEQTLGATKTSSGTGGTGGSGASGGNGATATHH